MNSKYQDNVTHILKYLQNYLKVVPDELGAVKIDVVNVLILIND